MTGLQNRIAPRGEIVAAPERGTMMGNRGGRLHDEARRLGRRRWASKVWIRGEVAFRGRRRIVMAGGYTELFFLDEAVAPAALRPCFERRRAEARAFAEASGARRAGEMDAALHAARVDRDRRQVVSVHRAGALPDGAFVELDAGPAPLLDGAALPWGPGSYGPPHRRPAGRVLVPTPAPTLRALHDGYRTRTHPSAGAGP